MVESAFSANKIILNSGFYLFLIIKGAPVHTMRQGRCFQSDKLYDRLS